MEGKKGIELATEAWEKRIAQWERSKKSRARWCGDEGVSYHQFLRWQRKLRPEVIKHPRRLGHEREGSFRELTGLEERESSPIEIQVGQYTVRVREGFSKGALVECLQALRGLRC